MNGWLLQSFNLTDPAVGESVSNVMAVFDAFPVRNRPLFVRGGAGLAIYTNNRPNGFGGSGLAWMAGLGYEIPLTHNVGLTPTVDYASGRLGDVHNVAALAPETGRRYSVIEFKAALVFHFGKFK